MTSNDRTRFAALMSGMAISFRQPAGEALMAAWWLGLADLEYAALEAAVKRGLRECKFMPSVAELREFALPKRRGLPEYKSPPRPAPWPELPPEEAAERKHRRLRSSPRPASEPTGMAPIADLVASQRAAAQARDRVKPAPADMPEDPRLPPRDR